MMDNTPGLQLLNALNLFNAVLKTRFPPPGYFQDQMQRGFGPPRMPYSYNQHRYFHPRETPYHRNHVRRRHHLDDIYYPNYEDFNAYNNIRRQTWMPQYVPTTPDSRNREDSWKHQENASGKTVPAQQETFTPKDKIPEESNLLEGASKSPSGNKEVEDLYERIILPEYDLRDGTSSVLPAKDNLVPEKTSGESCQDCRKSQPKDKSELLTGIADCTCKGYHDNKKINEKSRAVNQELAVKTSSKSDALKCNLVKKKDDMSSENPKNSSYVPEELDEPAHTAGPIENESFETIEGVFKVVDYCQTSPNYKKKPIKINLLSPLSRNIRTNLFLEPNQTNSAKTGVDEVIIGKIEDEVEAWLNDNCKTNVNHEQTTDKSDADKIKTKSKSNTETKDKTPTNNIDNRNEMTNSQIDALFTVVTDEESSHLDNMSPNTRNKLVMFKKAFDDRIYIEESNEQSELNRFLKRMDVNVLNDIIKTVQAKGNIKESISNSLAGKTDLTETKSIKGVKENTEGLATNGEEAGGDNGKQCQETCISEHQNQPQETEEVPKTETLNGKSVIPDSNSIIVKLNMPTQVDEMCQETCSQSEPSGTNKISKKDDTSGVQDLLDETAPRSPPIRRTRRSQSLTMKNTKNLTLRKIKSTGDLCSVKDANPINDILAKLSSDISSDEFSHSPSCSDTSIVNEKDKSETDSDATIDLSCPKRKVIKKRKRCMVLATSDEEDKSQEKSVRVESKKKRKRSRSSSKEERTKKKSRDESASSSNSTSRSTGRLDRRSAFVNSSVPLNRPKRAEIKQRRRTYNCDPENEGIVRRANDEKHRDTYLRLFGSYSDEEGNSTPVAIVERIGGQDKRKIECEASSSNNKKSLKAVEASADKQKNKKARSSSASRKQQKPKVFKSKKFVEESYSDSSDAHFLKPQSSKALQKIVDSKDKPLAKGPVSSGSKVAKPSDPPKLGNDEKDRKNKKSVKKSIHSATTDANVKDKTNHPEKSHSQSHSREVESKKKTSELPKHEVNHQSKKSLTGKPGSSNKSEGNRHAKNRELNHNKDDKKKDSLRVAHLKNRVLQKQKGGKSLRDLNKDLKLSPRPAKLNELERRKSAPSQLSSSTASSSVKLPPMLSSAETKINIPEETCCPLVLTKPIHEFMRLQTVEDECIYKCYICESPNICNDLEIDSQSHAENDLIEVRVPVPLVDLTEDEENHDSPPILQKQIGVEALCTSGQTKLSESGQGLLSYSPTASDSKSPPILYSSEATIDVPEETCCPLLSPIPNLQSSRNLQIVEDACVDGGYICKSPNVCNKPKITQNQSENEVVDIKVAGPIVDLTEDEENHGTSKLRCASDPCTDLKLSSPASAKVRKTEPGPLSCSTTASDVQLPPILYSSEATIDFPEETCCPLVTHKPVIKLQFFRRPQTVEDECVDRCFVCEPPEIYTDSKIFTQIHCENDVIEIRVPVPLVDLTEDEEHRNSAPKQSLADDLFELKREILESDKYTQDASLVTLYPSEECLGDQEVQAVSATVPLRSNSQSGEEKLFDEKKSIGDDSTVVAHIEKCFLAGKMIKNTKPILSMPSLTDLPGNGDTFANVENELNFQMLQSNTLTNKSGLQMEYFSDNTETVNLRLGDCLITYPRSNLASIQQNKLPAAQVERPKNSSKEKCSTLEPKLSKNTIKPTISPFISRSKRASLQPNQLSTTRVGNRPTPINSSSEKGDARTILSKNTTKPANIHLSGGSVNYSSSNQAPLRKNQSPTCQIVNNNCPAQTMCMEEKDDITLKSILSKEAHESGKMSLEEILGKYSDVSVRSAVPPPAQVPNCSTSINSNIGYNAKESSENPTKPADFRSVNQQNRKTASQVAICGDPIHVGDVLRESIVPISIVPNHGQVNHSSAGSDSQRNSKDAAGTWFPPSSAPQNRMLPISSEEAHNTANTSLLSPAAEVSLSSQQYFPNKTSSSIDHLALPELSANKFKMVMQVFMKHLYFLIHLLHAQNLYKDALKNKMFCPNFFRVELNRFESEICMRVLEQATGFFNDLSLHGDIVVTRNLSRIVENLIEKIVANLNLIPDLPKKVSKATVYLLLKRLMDPYLEEYNKNQLFKVLLDTITYVARKAGQKSNDSLLNQKHLFTEEMRRTLENQIGQFRNIMSKGASVNNLGKTMDVVPPPNVFLRPVNNRDYIKESLRRNERPLPTSGIMNRMYPPTNTIPIHQQLRTRSQAQAFVTPMDRLLHMAGNTPRYLPDHNVINQTVYMNKRQNSSIANSQQAILTPRHYPTQPINYSTTNASTPDARQRSQIVLDHLLNDPAAAPLFGANNSNSVGENLVTRPLFLNQPTTTVANVCPTQTPTDVRASNAQLSHSPVAHQNQNVVQNFPPSNDLAETSKPASTTFEQLECSEHLRRLATISQNVPNFTLNKPQVPSSPPYCEIVGKNNRSDIQYLAQLKASPKSPDKRRLKTDKPTKQIKSGKNHLGRNTEGETVFEILDSSDEETTEEVNNCQERSDPVAVKPDAVTRANTGLIEYEEKDNKSFVPVDENASAPSATEDVTAQSPNAASKEAIETVDLTFLDDMDENAWRSEIDFVFVKQEQSEDGAEQNVNQVRVASTDSGISSPIPTQGDEGMTTVYVQRLCICGRIAKYICECEDMDTWYCGRECQVNHWETHRLVCGAVFDDATDD